MKSIHFDYAQSCLVNKETLDQQQTKLQDEIERISQARTQKYDNDYASVNLPFDEKLVATIQATVKETKRHQPTTLVVIGIGGSNLGTIAVLEALRGKFYNEHHEVKVYFVDTVDTD